MVAVPSAVSYLTVTADVLVAERVTVKVALVVPALPSVTVASLIDMVGAGVVTL